MRFKLSRLAQAIIVAALCSSTAIAVDTGERIARPYVPEVTDNSVITANNRIYGPVTKADTTWSIANKIRKQYPGQGLTTRQIMRVLYRKNRQAYADGQLDSLLAGSYLAIPSLDEIKTGIAISSSKQPVKSQPVNTPITEAKPVLTTNEAATSTAAATILPAPAPAPAPPKEPATVTVFSAEQPLVDSKVSELVNGTVSDASATIMVSAAESQTEEVLKYQAENKELKEQIERLNAEINTLRASVQEQEKTQKEQQKQVIEQSQTIKPVQEKKTEPVPPDTTTLGAGSWNDILALPLHVQLLMSLPVLAFLVVLSIWLRARIRHEPVVHNQKNAESEIQITPAVVVPPVADSTEVQNIANIIPDAQPVEAAKEADEPAPLLTATDEHVFVAETGENAAMSVPAFTAEPEKSDFIPEPDVNIVADVAPVSASAEMNDAILASRLNLNKIMAAHGLQMSEQVVSEPEGWALPVDEETPTVLIATIAPNVNLKEVHNDSNRSWLQQFEPEQLKDKSSEGKGYLTIDELLSQAEQQEVEGTVDPDMIQPNLDVGLDAYPDMLPKHDGVDIDNDGGVGNKLDLARAYLEIDDKASAKALLLEAMADGDNEQIKEAVRLLSRTV